MSAISHQDFPPTLGEEEICSSLSQELGFLSILLLPVPLFRILSPQIRFLILSPALLFIKLTQGILRVAQILTPLPPMAATGQIFRQILQKSTCLPEIPQLPGFPEKEKSQPSESTELSAKKRRKNWREELPRKQKH